MPRNFLQIYIRWQLEEKVPEQIWNKVIIDKITLQSIKVNSASANTCGRPNMCSLSLRFQRSMKDLTNLSAAKHGLFAEVACQWSAGERGSKQLCLRVLFFIFTLQLHHTVQTEI